MHDCSTHPRHSPLKEIPATAEPSRTLRRPNRGPKLGALGILSLVTFMVTGCTEIPAAQPPMTPAGSTAIFAGGCFWCMESDFEKLPGVIDVQSGYTGGHTVNPTYEQVGTGTTGHAESVRVTYDPKRITYPQLLDYFWRHIDPTVRDRQFCDIGPEYRSAIFWQNEDEHKAAEASRDALLKSGKFPAIETELAPAGPFWPAEEYHQNYYRKNPVRYNYYRLACGRDARVQHVWGSAE